MSKCIITGCDLVDTYGGFRVHGDLHVVGNAFVFNSTLNEKGEANREYCDPFKALAGPRMAIEVTGDYFERRGVMVINFEQVVPNAAALDYVGEAFARETL
jgi:hypothetical protein